MSHPNPPDQAPPPTPEELREFFRAQCDFVRLYLSPPGPAEIAAAGAGGVARNRTALAPMVVLLVRDLATGTDQFDVLAIADGFPNGDAAAGMCRLGEMTAGERKAVRAVAFMAEAWAAVYDSAPGGRLSPGAPRPRDRADRREVISVAAAPRAFDGSGLLSATAPITRGPGNEIILGEFEESVSSRCHTLEAFWAGYARGCVKTLPPTVRSWLGPHRN